MSKQEYAAYLSSLSEELSQREYPNLDEARSAFLKTGDTGGLNWLGHLIDMEGSLYLYNGEAGHMRACRKAVFTLCDLQDTLVSLKPVFSSSENGFVEALKASGFAFQHEEYPIVESAFSFGPAMKTLHALFDAGHFDARERARIEKLCIAETAALLNEAEWGPHNRCVLRAVLLFHFAGMFPMNPKAAEMRTVAKRLFEQNVGHWSIEDAIAYSAIWINALSEYLKAGGVWDASVDAVMGYYANYYAAILLPSGGHPEHGDSRFDMGIESMLTLSAVELVAARHRDGQLRYAADRLFQNVVNNRTIDAGYQATRGLTNALLWADDTILPEKPEWLSCEALCDMIGKKIVYRSGWDERAQYLLYNYRDVGPYARLGRSYLMRSIPVHAEKPHHGHADEQSIAALCANGAVLLRDGGYRDSFTTDGHYRADFYHNRMILRPGRMFREQGLLAYAENIGDYQQVTTEKLFFERFSFAEVSRTRLRDEKSDMEWDRGIVRLKDDGIFIVIDSLKALSEGPRTAGALYWGKTVEKVSDGSYRIPEDEPEGLYWFRRDREALCREAAEKRRVHGTQSLLLAFAGSDRLYSVEERRRSYRQEQGVSQFVSRYYLAGEYYNFVSVLIPETGDSPLEIAASRARASSVSESLRMEPKAGGKCLEITLTAGAARVTVGWKNDELYGTCDLNARPAYTYEAGKAAYGAFETDALLLAARKDAAGTAYALVEATRLDVSGKTAFASRAYQNLQLDFTRKPGVWSWGSFEGKF